MTVENARNPRSSYVMRFALGFITVSIVGAVLWPLLPPRYTAPASFVLLVSTRDDEPGAIGRAQRQIPDESETQSDIDLLSSPELNDRVVDAQDLMHDPEFDYPGSTFGNAVRAIAHGLLDFVPLVEMTKGGSRWLATDWFPDPPATTRAVVRERLAKHLKMVRDRRSYTVTFSYWSADPDKAKTLTASLLDAYVALQADRKREAIARTTGWLDARVTMLRDRSAKADERVKGFMKSTGLIDVGAQASLENQLITLSTQYALARTVAIEASTRADSLRAMKALRTLQDAPDVIASPVVQRLKENFGSTIANPYVTSQLVAESDHIVSAASAQELEQRQRVALLEGAIINIRHAIQTRAEAQLALDVLQRDARAAHTVLEDSLVRLGGQTALVRVIAPDVFVVERPEVPLKPSFPNPILGFLGIFLAACVAGFGLALRFHVGAGGRIPARLRGLVAAE